MVKGGGEGTGSFTLSRRGRHGDTWRYRFDSDDIDESDDIDDIDDIDDTF